MTQLFSLLPICTILFTAILITDAQTPQGREYLSGVLQNLRSIKSAHYTVTAPVYAPGDEVPMRTDTFLMREHDNPLDTTIGASFGRFEGDGDQRLMRFYDGKVRGKVFWDRRTVIIDDFTDNPYPIRLVTPPFFNYVESILYYALEKGASTDIALDDLGEVIRFRLTIQDKIVEFVGRPFETEDPLSLWPDKASRYTIWISKSDSLPFHIKRVMPHNTSERICSDVVLNPDAASNFTAEDYYPTDFAIEKLDRRRKRPPLPLVGQNAPDFTLPDADGRMVRLAELTSKVLLLEFTGIGCGPCQMALPFLKTLAEQYDTSDFELVSIESWNSNAGAHRRYRDRNELNYKFLICSDAVRESYSVRGVPAFMLLDQERRVVEVLTGYNRGQTDQKLRAAINGLLSER